LEIKGLVVEVGDIKSIFPALSFFVADTVSSEVTQVDVMVSEFAADFSKGSRCIKGNGGYILNRCRLYF
jgi:hypothetical protein